MKKKTKQRLGGKGSKSGRAGATKRVGTPGLLPITGMTYERTARTLTLRDAGSGESLTSTLTTQNASDSAAAFASVAQFFDPAARIVQFQAMGHANGAVVRPAGNASVLHAYSDAAGHFIVSWGSSTGGSVPREMFSELQAERLMQALTGAKGAASPTTRSIEEIAGAAIMVRVLLP